MVTMLAVLDVFRRQPTPSCARVEHLLRPGRKIIDHRGVASGQHSGSAENPRLVDGMALKDTTVLRLSKWRKFSRRLDFVCSPAPQVSTQIE